MMNRRDMIMIAALLNGIILAALFMLATHEDSAADLPLPAIHSVAVSTSEPLAVAKGTIEPPAAPKEAYGSHELEHEFADYSLPSPEMIFGDDDVTLYADSSPEKEFVPADVVEISVKSGDFLEKLAKANGTTVEAIKELNQLKSERLKIGQILKVPVGTVHYKAEAPKQLASTPALPSSHDADAVYYTIKSGDNPWKIAKQFRVKTEDLLRLNQLNEEKARNLKAGDRIRIK
jgi:LysM repeat protein